MTWAIFCRNIELFKSCDKVVILIDYNPFSDYKMNVFEKEIEMLSNRMGNDILNKFLPVINKFNPNMYGNYQERNILKKEVDVKISFDINVYSHWFLSVLNDNSSHFTKGVCELIRIA